MYQPYPTSTQMPEVRRLPIPPSLTNAVKVMYAGAAASLLGIIIAIATAGATKNALENKSPHLTASQVASAQHVLVAGSIAGGLIAAALWVFIARMCKNGKNWARITATVLLAVSTVSMITTPLAPEAVMVKVWALVVWLAGLAAVVLLWRRSSTSFFRGVTPA
jgi:hypothetical protein